MGDIIKATLEVLKLAPRYLVAVGLFAAALLFSGDDFLKKIGVFDFAQKYRVWLGLTFVASISLFGVSVSIYIIKHLAAWWYGRRLCQHIRDRLHRLTEDEKQILRFYFAENTRSNVLRVDDGVVQGLVADRIIYRSTTLGNLLEGFAHNINDYAWDYIHLNPDVLQGSTDTYRTDKRRGLW